MTYNSIRLKFDTISIYILYMRLIESKVQKINISRKIGSYSDSLSAVPWPILAIVSLSKLSFEINEIDQVILKILYFSYVCVWSVRSSCLVDKMAMTQPNLSHHSSSFFAARHKIELTYVCILNTCVARYILMVFYVRTNVINPGQNIFSPVFPSSSTRSLVQLMVGVK